MRASPTPARHAAPCRLVRREKPRSLGPRLTRWLRVDSPRGPGRPDPPSLGPTFRRGGGRGGEDRLRRSGPRAMIGGVLRARSICFVSLLLAPCVAEAQAPPPAPPARPRLALPW